MDAVDWERVQLLAALDANSTRFLADMERAQQEGGSTDAALVKWYWHPEVGARIRSGSWFGGELPDALRRLREVAGMRSSDAGFDSMPWGDILGGGT
jgi:hypothetical protein